VNILNIVLSVHGGLGGELLGQLSVRIRTRVYRYTRRILYLPSVTINICLDNYTILCVISWICDNNGHNVVKDERFLVDSLHRSGKGYGVSSAAGALVVLLILFWHTPSSL
jgi:hypothetical protein